MGTPKALLEVDGTPLVAHTVALLRQIFTDVVVVTSSEEIALASGVPATADRYVGKGPLAGIHAALVHFEDPVFVVACDMPHLNGPFIRYQIQQLADHDAVVPRAGAYDEPLHAVYTPECLAAIEHELQKEHVGPVDNIFKALDVRFIEEAEARRFDPGLCIFDNWNTPDDVKKSFGQSG
jgi:molybdopterin-guanine dinucleotide biosynthesis protein A